MIREFKLGGDGWNLEWRQRWSEERVLPVGLVILLEQNGLGEVYGVTDVAKDANMVVTGTREGDDLLGTSEIEDEAESFSRRNW